MADHGHGPNDFQGRTMIPQGTQENGVPFGHEKSDANVRSTLIASAIILSFTLVVMLAMGGMFAYLNNREKAKDKNTPALFSRRVDPPKPWLLPSPQQDQLPWAAYEDERRAQEATGAKIGIIDMRTGVYKAPRDTGDARASQQKYFASKYRWETNDDKYTSDATGGRLLNTDPKAVVTPAGANDPLPGHTMTQPVEPVRNGRQIVRGRQASQNAAPAAPGHAAH